MLNHAQPHRPLISRNFCKAVLHMRTKSVIIVVLLFASLGTPSKADIAYTDYDTTSVIINGYGGTYRYTFKWPGGNCAPDDDWVFWFGCDKLLPGHRFEEVRELNSHKLGLAQGGWHEMIGMNTIIRWF